MPRLFLSIIIAMLLERGEEREVFLKNIVMVMLGVVICEAFGRSVLNLFLLNSSPSHTGIFAL